MPGDYAFCPYCGGVTRARRPSNRQPRSTTPGLALSQRPSEHRVVTVLFADVCGFTALVDSLDAETLTHMLNRLFAHFSAVVGRYDGFVDKFIGDAALVLFGAPVAHEDSSERAVRTARDLMQSLISVNAECAREYGVNPSFQIHIGIATGRVVAGWLGTPERGGYTVIGPAANLASRLCDMSLPMQVVVCENTANALRGTFPTHPFQATVDGQSRRLHRVMVNDERASPAWPQPYFVGRRKPLEALKRNVSGLRHGRGGFLVVTGKAGIGKTRLVEAALGACPGPIDIAQASRFDTTSPLSLFIPMVGRWLKAIPEDERATLQGHQWLLDLASGNYGKRPVPDAEQFRTTALDALAGLVVAVMRGKPRTLIVDNVQWADATSRTALDSIRKLTAEYPLLVIVVGRVDPRIASLRADHHWQVGPLSDDDLVVLIRASARTGKGGDHVLTAAEVERIAKRSGGVPLFAEELARHAVMNPDDDETVSPTIHSLVAARHDAMPPQSRVRLELASVFMRFFEPAAVDELAGLPYDPEAWASLEASGDVVVEQAGSEMVQYRLGHPMAQEVLYDTMLRQRRRELHAEIGDRLAASEEMVPRHALAWHMERAGRNAEAAAAWLEAAAQAVCLFANIEALNLYERAAALADEGEVVTRSAVAQAQLLSRMGRLNEAGTILESVGDDADARGDLASKSWAYAERAFVAYRSGDAAAIARFADVALRAARDVGDRKLVAAALRQVGISHEFAGRYGPAERAYREVLAQERELMTSAYLVGVYNSLGEIARQSERPDVALMWYDKSQRVFERTQPGALNVVGFGNRGAALVALKRHEQARPLLLEAISEQVRTGYRSHMAEPLCYLAQSLASTGEAEGARERLATAMDLARENGEKEMQALTLQTLGHLLELGVAPLDGEPSTSREAYAAAAAQFADSGKRVALARCLTDLSRADGADGDMDTAATHLQEAIAHFEALDLQVLAAKATAKLTQLRTRSSGLVAGSK